MILRDVINMEIENIRKIVVYDLGNKLKVFIGESPGSSAYTVPKDRIIEMCEDTRCRMCDLGDSIGGMLNRVRGLFRRD